MDFPVYLDKRRTTTTKSLVPHFDPLRDRRHQVPSPEPANVAALYMCPKYSDRCVFDHQERIARTNRTRESAHAGTFPGGISDSHELVFSFPSIEAHFNSASEIRDIFSFDSIVSMT